MMHIRGGGVVRSELVLYNKITPESCKKRPQFLAGRIGWQAGYGESDYSRILSSLGTNCGVGV